MFSPYHIAKLFFVFAIRDQVNLNISELFSRLLSSCCAASSFWFRYAQDYRYSVCGPFIGTVWGTKISQYRKYEMQISIANRDTKGYDYF